MHKNTRVGLALLAGFVALGAWESLSAAQPRAPQPQTAQPRGLRAPVDPRFRPPSDPRLRLPQSPPQAAAPQAAPPQASPPQAAAPKAAAPKASTVKDRIAARAPDAKTRAGEYALSGTRSLQTQPKKDFLGLVVFFLLAFGCAGFSLVMITRKSPMMAALSLLVVFLCLAGIYVLLKAPFMAAIQLIVYAGAVIVLFIFVIMSMGLQETYASKDMAKEVAYFLAGFLLTGSAAMVFFYAEGLRALGLAGLLFAATAAGFVVYLKYPFTRLLGMTAASFAAVQIMRLATLTGVVLELPRPVPGEATRLLPVASPLADDFGSPQSVGRSVFLDNAFAFEALSLLLLAAIVAAVVIVRSRKEAAS